MGTPGGPHAPISSQSQDQGQSQSQGQGQRQGRSQSQLILDPDSASYWASHSSKPI